MSEDVIWRRAKKTVYILGAGFSKLAGIPTISEFIPQAFQTLKDKKLEDKLQEFCELIDKYQIGAIRLGLPPENLEALFCLVDLPSINEINSNERRHLIDVIIGTLLNKFKCWSKDRNNHMPCNEGCCVPRGHLFQDGQELRCIPRYKYGVCIYEAFLSQVLDGQKKQCENEDDMHAIITFNYDLVIEEAVRALQNPEIFYGKYISNETASDELICADLNNNLSKKLLYLKIHGSLNWISRGDTYANVEIGKTIKDLRQDPELSLANNKCVPLVPPTWKRGSVDGDIFAQMVSHTIRHLQLASKIVIIGYSFPAYDIYFKYMLARALNTPEFPEIEVWDVKKRSKMLSHLKHVFGPDNIREERVRYFEGGLRAFVTSHSHVKDQKIENV